MMQVVSPILRLLHSAKHLLLLHLLIVPPLPPPHYKLLVLLFPPATTNYRCDDYLKLYVQMLGLDILRCCTSHLSCGNPASSLERPALVVYLGIKRYLTKDFGRCGSVDYATRQPFISSYLCGKGAQTIFIRHFH